MKILQLVTMSLFTLVAGVFWGTWFSLSRSIAALTPATFLEVGRTMIANLGGPMSVLLPATIVSVLVLVVVLYRRAQQARVRIGCCGSRAAGRFDRDYADGQRSDRRSDCQVDGGDLAARLGEHPEQVGVLPWACARH